jgi:hypothetical protein
MHALPSHPRHPLVAGLVALLVALLVMAATAPDLGTLDLSVGGGVEAPNGEQVARPQVGAEPTWVAEPLAAPLDELRGR